MAEDGEQHDVKDLMGFIAQVRLLDGRIPGSAGDREGLAAWEEGGREIVDARPQSRHPCAPGALMPCGKA